MYKRSKIPIIWLMLLRLMVEVLYGSHSNIKYLVILGIPKPYLSIVCISSFSFSFNCNLIPFVVKQLKGDLAKLLEARQDQTARVRYFCVILHLWNWLYLCVSLSS